ncbi:MAG: hypothetical protein WAT51_07835, partial [Holophaga sp.]
TWEEGLTRLALGRFMQPEAQVEGLGAMGRPVGSGSETAALLAILGPLVSDLRALSQERHPLPVWQDRLTHFFMAYLGPDPDAATEAEAKAFADLLRALPQIGKLEVEGLAAPVLDFQAARPLVQQALEALLKDRSLPPGRGVQVSCYTPLRAIPFKVLILMGLGEGIFPGVERPDPLDLVASSPRRAGDVSRPEQERHLFLEAILCTRQHLVLTYPSRAAITGEALQPSPLLRDLEETLGQELWARVHAPEQPLHRHDLAHFPELSPEALERPLPSHLPEARREAEARWLGVQLRRQVGGVDLPRHLADWGEDPGLQAALEGQVGACGPVGALRPAPPPRSRITLKELRRWLECPVQGGVALRLGVRAPREEDPAEVQDDTLDTDALETWGLLRKTLWTALAQGAELDACYTELRDEAEAAAKAPLGALSLGERARHLQRLEHWAALMGTPAGLVLHRFGVGQPLETQGLPILDHPPLSLAIPTPEGPLEWRLEGLTEPMQGDDFLLLSTSEYTEAAPAARDQREALRAWLGHVALCASGGSRARRAKVLCVPFKKPPQVWVLPLPALDAAEARTQLARWGREILVDADQAMLPIAALLSDTDIPDLADWIEDQQERENFKSLTSFRGPVPRIKELPA